MRLAVAVQLELGGQHDEQRLSLDAQFGRGPLDLERQRVAGAGRSHPCAGRGIGPVTPPYLGHAPAQPQHRHNGGRVLGYSHAPSCPVGCPDGNARRYGTSPGTPHRIARQRMPSSELRHRNWRQKAIKNGGPVPAAGGRPDPVLHRAGPGTAVHGQASVQRQVGSSSSSSASVSVVSSGGPSRDARVQISPAAA